MVIIVTYRPDDVLPERIRGIIDPPETEGISLRPIYPPYLAMLTLSRVYQGCRRRHNSCNIKASDRRGCCGLRRSNSLAAEDGSNSPGRRHPFQKCWQSILYERNAGYLPPKAVHILRL